MKLNDNIYIYIKKAMNWAMDSLSWCFVEDWKLYETKKNKRNSFSIFSQIFVYILYFIKESKYFILCYYPQIFFTVLPFLANSGKDYY
jgi:hypothetical protein